jgi:SAM-dependent methyltransferase
LRNGRILDIGCGSYPAFLTGTRFEEGYGLDRVPLQGVRIPGLTLVEHDIAGASPLAFADSFFDVVTMLAVFEHLEVPTLRTLPQEIRRVLGPDGLYVMTTPARWTESILKFMSSLKLVSHEEIGEHKAQYSAGEVVSVLGEAAPSKEPVKRPLLQVFIEPWHRMACSSRRLFIWKLT